MRKPRHPDRSLIAIGTVARIANGVKGTQVGYFQSMSNSENRTGRRFTCMAGTYCLGTFNDNFFKQAASLLAISLGMSAMQGWLTILFTIPYLLFAAPAGWLADRFPKNRIVVQAKVLELLAMLCGGMGILIGNWFLIMAMAFFMGLQSCLFGPALNGSIPELYPPEKVPRANGILKVVVTSSILLGALCSGLARESGKAHDLGEAIVAGGVVLIATLGLAIAFGVQGRPAADPDRPFPWSGPVDTINELRAVRRDPLLNLIFYADAVVWGGGMMILFLINLLAKNQLAGSDHLASILLGCELGGVAIGGLCGGFLGSRRNWYNLLPPTSLLLGISLAAFPLLLLMPPTATTITAMILLFVAGFAGGAFMIPCESFVQIRPTAQRKGAVIAASNFLVFLFIIIASLIYNLLGTYLLPTTSFCLVGLFFIVFAVLLYRKIQPLEKPND